jgi:hypothetical protein
MKKTIKTIILLLIIAISFANKPTSSYCDGFEEGFCQGWKNVKGQNAICPITPVCPVPKVDCSEGYKCGYNRGFKVGYFKAKASE